MERRARSTRHAASGPARRPRQPHLLRFVERQVVDVDHAQPVGEVGVADQRVGPVRDQHRVVHAPRPRPGSRSRRCRPTTGAADGGRAARSAGRSSHTGSARRAAAPHARSSVTGCSLRLPTATGTPASSTRSGSIRRGRPRAVRPSRRASGIPAIVAGPCSRTSVTNSGGARRHRCLDPLGDVDRVAHQDPSASAARRSHRSQALPFGGRICLGRAS